MRKLSFLVLLTALVFIFPVMAISWEDEPAVATEAGIADESETDAAAPEGLKDERVLALMNECSAELQALLEEIQDEPDPLERERLQKKIEALKADQEITLTELYLEIALERGDEDRVIELQNVLDQLYEPNVAEPSNEDRQPLPGGGNEDTKEPSKNPDDA